MIKIKFYLIVYFLLVLIPKTSYSMKFAIFIPDNLETNVYSNEKFNKDMAKKYLSEIYKQEIVNTATNETGIFEDENYLDKIINSVETIAIEKGLCALQIKNNNKMLSQYCFYQEKGGGKFGRRRLLKDIKDYAQIYVFENKNKLLKCTKTTKIKNDKTNVKLIYLSLDKRYVILNNGEKIYDGNRALQSSLYSVCKKIFNKEMGNESSLNKEIEDNNSIRVMYEITNNSPIWCEYNGCKYYFYQKGGGKIFGVARLLHDIKQMPYEHIVYVIGDMSDKAKQILELVDEKNVKILKN